MTMRKTIIIKTKDGLDRNGLNDLFDKLQDMPGVHSVSLPNVDPDPDQLPLWPDEPAEQKLFAKIEDSPAMQKLLLKATITWPDGSTEVSESEWSQ